MLQPEPVAPDWWYIAPRSGHISIHRKRSLKQLWSAVGLDCISLSQEWHLAFNRLPAALSLDALQRIISALPTGFIFL